MKSGLHRSVLKAFSFDGVPVREQVAATSGRHDREKGWRDKLRHCRSERRACARLGFYPKKYKSIFSFRVDADEYDSRMFDRFFQTAKKYSHGISLFFSMANYERCPHEIRRCHDEGMEIHSHAYIHYTYRSYEQNRWNLQRADAILEKVGIARHGFASPYGRWNKALQRAIEERGYEFSSEFSYDYDNLPSYPNIDGRSSRVLQVPVHPVGLGIYQESSAPYSTRQVQSHFGSLFEKKYKNQEPILFYDHPTKWLGVYPEFMDFLFQLASAKKDVWICRMGEWAAWWKKRDLVRWEFNTDAGKEEFSLRVTQDPAGVSENCEVEIFHPYENSSTFFPLGSGVSKGNLSRLDWRPFSEPETYDDGEIIREKKITKRLKRILKNWLDWETSTPRNEIIRESFPSVIKSSLRYWSDSRHLK